MWKFFAVILIMAMIPLAGSALPIHIIPEPVSVEERDGEFAFSPRTPIYLLSGDKEAIRVVKDFASVWRSRSDTRFEIHIADLPPIGLSPIGLSPAGIFISLEPGQEIKNGEGYSIDIDPRRVNIVASTPAGLFYAFKSIEQLAICHSIRHCSMPCCHILDYPRFAYRGMHLDVSRHFFSAAYIKKYLDILADFKINTFHWHLTDSHGWRIEIKEYPKLTSVGAWRAERKGIPMTIAQPTATNEPAEYGGFYTQQEIRGIVEYAKERFITIVPEIEMPGHCEAALIAYPQFADLDNKIPLLMPCGYPGDLQHNFCVGYDSTFIFLQHILSEVMQLFPSPFIHIGGDEVRPAPWLNCPRCRERMKENGLQTRQQLQAWFTRRIDSFITASGKRMIGWDEIMQTEISPGAAVMSWHGDSAAMAAVKKGHDVVMATYHYTYFDFYQSDPDLEPDITYAPLFLDTVYAFEPLLPGLTTGDSGHIVGAEACLWTENVPTPARVEYMLLPRLLALSEVLWTPPEKKNYAKFITKVEASFKRFDAEKIHYSTSLYNVSILPVFNSSQKSISIALSDQAKKYDIRYTLDGSAPQKTSLVYFRPLTITHDTRVTATLFRHGKKLSRPNMQHFTVNKATGASIRVYPAPLGGPGDPAATDPATVSSYARLVDGIFGTVEPYDGRWVPFHDSVTRFVIDLGSEQTIHSVGFRYMEDQVSDMILPRKVELELSDEGISYKPVYQIENKTLPQQLLRHIVKYDSGRINRRARYLRLIVSNANLSADPAKNMIVMDEIAVK
jgi:hexosaminidase